MKIPADLQQAYDTHLRDARAGNTDHFIVYLIERIATLEARGIVPDPVIKEINDRLAALEAKQAKAN